MLFEDLSKVIQMVFTNIFDSEIVDYKEKFDWTPLLAPHPWCLGGLIIIRIVESFFHQVVS